MNTEFKINGLQIETARLILRPFRQTDLEDFFEYASVEGVDEMAGWVHHKNKEISQKILDLFIFEDKTFAICLKSNHKVIGSLLKNANLSLTEKSNRKQHSAQKNKQF